MSRIIVLSAVLLVTQIGIVAAEEDTHWVFEEGERNEMVDRLPSFRVQRGEEPYGDPIDYNELVTDRGEYFLYNGSLTTPPCTEGVRWIVIKQPIVASPDQIQHYHDLLGFDNNRPIQPEYSRIVLD